jgi:hypothetical protein
MDNIPEGNTHIACDEFYDATLRLVMNGHAVFEWSGRPKLIDFTVSAALVGQTGLLKVLHTRHGEIWRFQPYVEQNWRRLPEGDDPAGWGWQCIETGMELLTEVGSQPAPSFFPSLPAVDEVFL